jgi:ankyrin repeat protein
MKRPAMVQLLLELGADPLAVDGAGMPVAGYAEDPHIDLPVLQRIRTMTLEELDSANRGHRSAHLGAMDLLAAVALRDWETASTIAAASPTVVDHGGALHLLAKRGDASGVKWFLEHGADPNRTWAHWDSEVTALHLAALTDAADVVQALLTHGADPGVRDSKHASDAGGWAEFFKRTEIVRMLNEARRSP